jgi:hypothetical protein
MAHAVPIRVMDENGAAVPGMVAVFYFLEPSGQIGKVVDHVPIQNGVAVYNGGPPPQGAFFGITVHEGAGLPVFRSGRLSKLPGPPSEIVATSRINLFRSSVGAATGLNSADAAPHLIHQRLSRLPSRWRIDHVRLGANSAGHELVTVQGRVRRLLWFEPFVYTLALTLRIASEPGHPENIILVEPAGPGSGTNLGSLRPQLEQAIVEGAKDALDAAARHIATLQHLFRGIDFPATFVSLTSLTIEPNEWDPSIIMLVHGGSISGVTGGVSPHG